jgi:hypothetical protein
VQNKFFLLKKKMALKEVIYKFFIFCMIAIDSNKKI